MLFLREISWFAATLLGIASLRAAGKPPRRKAWFVPGALGIVLAVSGIALAVFVECPSSLRAKVAPVSYRDMPLPRVLQDLSRQARSQGRYVMFVVHEDDLKAQRITYSTRETMPLRKVLRGLTRSAGCSFSYARCGTCGGLLGPITIFKHHPSRQERDGQLTIRDDGITDQGVPINSVPENEDGDATRAPGGQAETGP